MIDPPLISLKWQSQHFQVVTHQNWRKLCQWASGFDGETIIGGFRLIQTRSALGFTTSTDDPPHLLATSSSSRKKWDEEFTDCFYFRLKSSHFLSRKSFFLTLRSNFVARIFLLEQTYVDKKAFRTEKLFQIWRGSQKNEKGRATSKEREHLQYLSGYLVLLRGDYSRDDPPSSWEEEFGFEGGRRKK